MAPPTPDAALTWPRLLWAGVWRTPLRTALTAASLAMAFLLYGLLTPILVLFAGRGDFAGADRLIVQPRHSITDFLPIAHVNAVAALPGVRAASHMTWFGGTYGDGAAVFPRWAVPADTFLDLHPDLLLPDATRAAFLARRDAAIVGDATARRLGLKAGDRIALVPDIWPNRDGGAWTFEVVGTFTGADPTVDTAAMYIRYDYFDAWRAWGQGLVSYAVAGVAAGASPADVAARIDARFANSAGETSTSSERDAALAFADRLGDVRLMLSIVLGSVLFAIALVAANTLAQGLRERLREFAVLSALGFGTRALVGLVVGEALLLVLLGAVPGIAAAAAAVAFARRSVAGLGLLSFDPVTALSAALATALLAGIAAAQPALRLLRTRPLDFLRR